MKFLTLLILILVIIILFILIIISAFTIKDKVSRQKNSISIIDFLNHSSKLVRINTGYKLFITLFLLIYCLINDNILISIFIILLTTWISINFGKVSLKSYLKLFIIPLSFLILSCLAIALNFDSKLSVKPILTIKLWSFYCFITKLSLTNSLIVFFRVLACISSLYFLIVNTPIDRVLACLKRYYFPNTLIELMFLMYRFIFFLWEITSQMITAAKLRFGFSSYPKTIKSIGMIGSNIFIVSFKKAQKFYNSMESRLYTGSLNFIFSEPRITIRQIVILGLGVFYLVYLYYFLR